MNERRARLVKKEIKGIEDRIMVTFHEISLDGGATELAVSCGGTKIVHDMAEFVEIGHHLRMLQQRRPVLAWLSEVGHLFKEKKQRRL